MNNSVKFSLPILLVALTSYGLSTLKQHQQIIPSVLAEVSTTTNNGLITITSPYNVNQTSDRLENIVQEKGLTLFARIDHSLNAANAGLELNPTQLLIIGNPQVGTSLMQCSITTAIDLPQKILVYQDQAQQTQIAYNHPEYLQQRHTIKGCDEILAKINTALQSITEAAVQSGY